MLMRDDTAALDDVAKGYVTGEFLDDGLKSRRIVKLLGTSRNVAVGHGLSIKVNTNIGISDKSSADVERKKLDFISTATFRPDMTMDHTIDPNFRDFWREMVASFDGPVGTLPHYTSFSSKVGFERNALLDRIEEMLEGGVSFMTLHFGADLDIYEIAKRTRPIPVTARGGGLVIRDLLLTGRNENIFRSLLPEIIYLFKKHHATISVGSTYRPPDIFSALDEAHVAETGRQIEIVKGLQAAGVKVIMEGVGHMTLDKIPTYIEMIAEANCPFMPLGPMTTDSAIGFDHVTNAIGGAMMGHLGGAHALNSVTSEEHTGGVPSFNSMVEGLKSARVAAHSVNVSRYERARTLDKLTIEQRGRQVSCVVSGGLFQTEVSDPQKGCNRCSFECPIVLAPASPVS